MKGQPNYTIVYVFGPEQCEEKYFKDEVSHRAWHRVMQNGAQLIWDNFRQIPVPEELPDKLNDYAEEMMSSRFNEAECSRISEEIDKTISMLYGINDGKDINDE